MKDFYFNIIIGGKCFIIKNEEYRNKNYALITLFNEKDKKFSNNIDYFFIIDNREELYKILNNILRNNIWNYFKEINYFYKVILKNYKF